MYLLWTFYEHTNSHKNTITFCWCWSNIMGENSELVFNIHKAFFKHYIYLIVYILLHFCQKYLLWVLQWTECAVFSCFIIFTNLYSRVEARNSLRKATTSHFTELLRFKSHLQSLLTLPQSLHQKHCWK